MSARTKPIPHMKPATPNGEPIIAALLMEGESYPFDRLRKQLSAQLIHGHRPTDVECVGDGILTCFVGDELLALALMPAPYPWSDLEGPCSTSWMWPEDQPASSVKLHRTHLLITATGGQASPIQRRLPVTRLATLASDMPGVMAVYWCEATVVHYPPVFRQIAEAFQTPRVPPLDLWVDFRLFCNEDGSAGLFTTGLEPLGLMELEIPQIQMPLQELRQWAVNMVYYQIANGPVLKHGDTIGVSARQQLRIRHRSSQFGKQGTVICLEP